MATPQSVTSNAATPSKKIFQSTGVNPLSRTDWAARITRHCPTRKTMDLDARAEPAWAEAAEMHGKAAFRRLQGEHDLAATFQRRAHAAERFAAALEADAFAKRLEAARMQGDADRWAELTSALAAIAA